MKCGAMKRFMQKFQVIVQSGNKLCVCHLITHSFNYLIKIFI